MNMCTAIYENQSRPLFGRTLDLEYSHNERVVITPRHFKLKFLREKEISSHKAIIGTAHIHNGYPLYYDAVNESGLAAAALSFPDNAVYRPYRDGARNIASFEVIPRLLSLCETISDAVALLEEINITNESFSTSLPSTPLHWLIADKNGAVTLECGSHGVQIYDNPAGVLTNSPPFEYHMTNLANYMQTGSLPPENRLCPSVELKHYSRGMGGLGLPGDFSSPSRFVRAVFAKNHTAPADNAEGEVSRFFHIMDTVSQPRGCALTEERKPIETVYTSCADLSSLSYYFTTYGHRQISAVSLEDTTLNGDSPICYAMERTESIFHSSPIKD